MGRRQILIANVLFEQALMQGNHTQEFWVENGLPAGAKLVDITFDGRTVTATFEHDQWAEAQDGAPIELMKPLFYTKPNGFASSRDMQLRAGDTLVLRTPGNVSSQTYRTLRESVARFMPEVSVLLLENGMTVDSVLHQPATDATPAT